MKEIVVAEEVVERPVTTAAYTLGFLENGRGYPTTVCFRSTPEVMEELFGVKTPLWSVRATTKEEIKRFLQKAREHPTVGILLGTEERAFFLEEKNALSEKGRFVIMPS